VTLYTCFYTASAPDAKVIVKFDHITAAITADFHRTYHYALMAVGTVLFPDANYFY
jgi:hypothetical protein